MIDWVTIRLNYLVFSDPPFVNSLLANNDRIMKISKDGELVWEKSCWESIQSDSHQISVRFGSDALWIQGSPTRLEGRGCNVFGEGASARGDLFGCVSQMVRFVMKQLGVVVKPSEWERFIKQWKVSRVDVTRNLLLTSEEEVKDTLEALRGVNTGRYRVSSSYGSTIYFSHSSRLKSGKAYAKGRHLLYQNKKGNLPFQYSDEEIELASHLLRLELKLGAQWWRERAGGHWSTVTAESLLQINRDYFNSLIGEATVMKENDIEARLLEVAPSKGQAKAAYYFWALIQSVGLEQAKAATAGRTFYRHLKLLRAIGLADADFSARKVTETRRPVTILQEVTSWGQLRELVAQKKTPPQPS